MLEMGIGVSLWFRSDGPLSESQVVYYYADMALRLVSSAQFGLDGGSLGHHVLAQYHVSCYEGQSRELT
jgi:hypothetical protein